MEFKGVSDFIHGLTIGSLKTDSNVFLAPMAGGSDIAFRKICRRLGAGMVFTELCTARGIRYRKSLDKTYRYLQISAEEAPAAIQLFGSDPEDFAEAIPLIFDDPVLAGCAAIDINMGCPVRKVVKTGAGSALMGDIKRAESIIKAAVKISPVPVTVKFRKGIDPLSVNAVQFARMCEDAGAAMITIHGRTADQMYSGKADWKIIGEVKNNAGIPVIGNGDVTGPGSACEMFRTTGADGIMIGRAALGDPWIFSEITRNSGRPGTPEMIRTMIRQLDDSVLYLGEKTALKEMRKHFSWYLKKLKGASEIRDRLFRCASRDEAVSILEEICVMPYWQ